MLSSYGISLTIGKKLDMKLLALVVLMPMGNAEAESLLCWSLTA